MEVDGSDVEKTIFAIFIRNVILTQANCLLISTQFLADCTNGHAYATVLCPPVCRPSVTYVLWLNGASYRKTVLRSK